MSEIIQTLPPNEKETVDTPKLFTNIDSEDFEFTWDNVKTIVPAGETINLPKYKVNYAAMHLAKKMYKRVAREKAEAKGIDIYRGEYPTSDIEEEKKLRNKIVAANFPKQTNEGVTQSPVDGADVKEKTEEVEDKVNPLKCSECDFTAKSKLGLASHMRFKHK